MTIVCPQRAHLIGLGVLLSLTCVVTARAQVVLVPSDPQIGSSNPITAEPPVPRPSTTPCIVPLFNNLAFDNFTPATFNYTPPSDCPGPWAKVVFTADFTVTEGRQFDRTAAFYLGHASIYYGTTAEPRATLSPSWHVERDLTDLSAIFASSQTGEANIGNFVGVSGGVTYNGIIYANAALEFYPADKRDKAPLVPDIVVPVNGTGGDAGTLNTTTDTISQILNLPTNVERVYLDVIAQSQSSDEFWWTCVPNTETSNVGDCGNTAFRETEITIDGQPAGVAPVYPWIYTGGIQPLLWEPIPGVQTLNFRPYRVDLSPFAGVLSDGNAHTVAVSVYNADSYFLATANLLVYQDHGSAKVRGGLLSNTLSMAPSPTIDDEIVPGTSSTGATIYTGTVTVSSKRKFEISGYLITSHGIELTTTDQTVNFVSAHTADTDRSSSVLNVQQSTTVDATTLTIGGAWARLEEKHFSYPFSFNDTSQRNADGSSSSMISSDQKFILNEVSNIGLGPATVIDESNEVNANYATERPAGGTTTITEDQTTQTYKLHTPPGNCWNRTITAVSQALTSVVDHLGCS